ncbi:DUF1588 domain-containing protein [Blastomonas fulva]|jgi:hypothetical protein|uniref:DUF1588 domain-containing protein n=1 Tax=Blastomonas fulva TaxID=1550728 RepID=UPI0025A472DA|nr:DUF1588 domain-containing protein [Blastomonas fulva]MDM7929657.1 DUF1588 domain-containing protein [Blastomonas fulva]MDM7965523.1 DUF1588 domain-containing protein [Blastomonas fulva]
MKIRLSTLLTLALLGAGVVGAGSALQALTGPGTQASSAPDFEGPRIVGMRRLTEAQYRNTIADIFGPDIRVAGRFEPIVRPAHELIASGASDASISPAGLEQFDAIGRGIAAQVFDAAHSPQFVTCTPANGAVFDDGCAARILTPIGRYLFRRPPSAAEKALFVDIAGRSSRATGSFTKGLELALAAMLVSPRFLYIVETARPDPDEPGAWQLDSYSRAARLSFVLWNTTPGEMLLQAAEQGRLESQAELEALAGRMVHSPRFEQGIRAFFADMLLFEKFDELAKDPVIYPYFTPDVAQALPEQTLRTITNHLLVDDGDYRALFTTPRTVMNRALGALYQVPVQSGRDWEPYEFLNGSDRAGLLGQAGFLAIYSHSGRSSPTLRGRAVREVLMCQPVPNPPGNVNFTAVQDVANKAMPTARIRLTTHNTDPVCAACHKITDPIGLTLERFDGIGAFRTAENATPIDISGAMDGAQFEGASGLGKALAESPDTTMCLASRALEYATGHPADDEAQVESLMNGFAGGGYRIRNLFLKIATMPEAFRVRPDPALGTPATTVALNFSKKEQRR